MKIFRVKRLLALLLCFLMALSCILTVSADDATVENEKEYKPLDLVVIIDRSGSMNDSDGSKTAPAAVRMLANMMPAEDSRIGIVTFSNDATTVTTDTNGNPVLYNLEDINDVATIRKKMAEVSYRGGTGIGNALIEATNLLSEHTSDDRSKAIILFTDGVNDLGNPVAMSKCEDNEANAVLWAKQNECPVYCVGYDYITDEGVSSMGENGEGIAKLTNIANTTNGKVEVINTIDEMQQLLIEFLADVCDLNYRTVALIPGDGSKHEVVIPISPSVVEANIRIAGGDENSIANGDIHLYDPAGNEIELRNSGNVRFDTDATAASIKIILPKTGEWLLTVENVVGDDIHIGLLEHFKMNLTSQLILPAGNPEGVAYTNDEIIIKSWLTYDGQPLTESAIYDAVKSATAVCVPRANPDDAKTVILQKDGFSFTGSFIIPQDCFYDITIRLDWDTVYREDTLEIKSDNKPLYLVSDIQDQKVNKRKTVAISDIYQYVADDENDSIVASVSQMSSPGVVDADIVGNDMTIKGNKWSSTTVTVTYTDAQGNSVQTIFKVKVNDPVAIALIITGIVLLGVLVVVLLILIKKASNRVRGRMRVISISEGFVDSTGDYKKTKTIYSNPNIDKDNTPTVSGGFNSPTAGNTGGFNPGTNGPGNPFGSGASPFGNSSPASGGAFGGGASPFGTADPLSNGSPSTFDSSNPFGAPVGTVPKAEQAQPQNEGIFDVFGNGMVDPMGNNQPGGVSISQEEEVRSNGFDERILIGGTTVRKTDLGKVMELFIKVYTDYMKAGVNNSKKAEVVKDFIESNLKPFFVRVYLIGTLYGMSGVVLKPEKNLLKGKLIVHTPRLIKDKAAMNPNNKRVTLSLSVPCGDKKTDGSIPCSHIEIEYSK